MKFDKETLIVMLLCCGALLAWYYVSPKMMAGPASSTAAEQIAVQKTEASSADSMTVSATVEKGKASPLPAVQEKFEKRKYSLANSDIEYFFSSTGYLHEVEMKKIKKTASPDRISVRETRGFEPFAFTVPAWKITGCSIEKTGDSKLTVARLVRGEGGMITVRQEFELPKTAMTLQCRMTLENHTSKNVTIPSFTLWGGTMPNLKNLSNDDLRDVYNVEYCLSSNKKVVTADPAAKEEKFLAGKTESPVEWIGVSNKYFLSLLYTDVPFNGGVDLLMSRVSRTGESDSGPKPEIGGIYRNLEIPAKKNLAFQYSLYAGPKDMEQMRRLPESAFNAIHLAYWSWLEPVCRPMLYLLNLLKMLCGSYGWAIVLLTLLVKLVLWPLIHKGNKSMRKLQKIQPLVKALKEKYKNTPQEFNAKMMELYKKEKVSPFGGCFPMLLQFPIFIALYSTLDSAVELRHVPFLWAADLSRPDLVGPTLLFGIGIHPFILISTGLMVLQQRLSPQMQDPMQQKMMMFMPVIMLAFFYNFPSGLALYWTVNNVLSILQMKYSQYSAAKEDALEEAAKKSGSSGKSARKTV